MAESQDNSGTSNLSDLNDSLVINSSFGPSDFNDLNDSSEIDSKYSEQHDITDKILYHYLRHNTTLTCLEDICKLMAMARASSREFPTTMYGLEKIMEERASISSKRNYFMKCPKCNIYSEGFATKHNNQCDKCKKKLVADETNFFIYIPLKNQIIQSLKLNWSYIERFNEEDLNTDSISDVHSAYFLRDLNDLFSKTNTNIISLMLNADGANKFKSNLLSVWPIQLVQNYLPPEIRYKPSNILTVGLYYGKKKPDCTEYFFPLISELKELQETGISLNVQNDLYTFYPMVTHCVVDLPAKHMLQRIKQYNGRNACTYCTHPGHTVLIKGKKRRFDTLTSDIHNEIMPKR